MSENAPHPRFALYLIPPYQVVSNVSDIHRILRKQFGIIAAEKFQAHCTIKGFFKKNSGPLTPLIQKLDTFFIGQKPFTVESSGIRLGTKSIVLDISKRGDGVNTELISFREGAVNTIRPFIAADCDFVAADLGPPFHAHITLAFNDIPKNQMDSIRAFLKDAPLPSGTFTADTYHFLEFTSPDWSGPWWETLTLKIHKSWILRSTYDQTDSIC